MSLSIDDLRVATEVERSEYLDPVTSLRPATPDDVRAAVLPLIDYEAARDALADLGPFDYTEDEIVHKVVDAALGLKEEE